MSFTRKAGAWPRAGRTARRPRIESRRARLDLMERLLQERSVVCTPCRCDFPRKISSRQRQVERYGQEDRHLAAGVRLLGAVVAAAAAGGDAVGRELLDPAGGAVARRDGGEAGAGGGGRVRVAGVD